VQRYYPDTDTYDVQDEDDTSKLIRLPWTHVMRLSTGAEGCFKRATQCMAIFPETTSFYRALVSKNPVWKLDRSNVPMVNEVIVKFEDDEDNQGKTPHRRVPSRYVIPLPVEYFYDETDDVELTPPTTK
jgi:SAGA-associated factor 29